MAYNLGKEHFTNDHFVTIADFHELFDVGVTDLARLLGYASCESTRRLIMKGQRIKRRRERHAEVVKLSREWQAKHGRAA